MLKFCVILAKFQEMGLGGPAGALVGKKFSDDPPTQGINFFEFFLLHLGYMGPCMNSQKFPGGLLIYLYFLMTFKVRTGPMRPRRVTGGLISRKAPKYHATQHAQMSLLEFRRLRLCIPYQIIAHMLTIASVIRLHFRYSKRFLKDSQLRLLVNFCQEFNPGGSERKCSWMSLFSKLVCHWLMQDARVIMHSLPLLVERMRI